MYRETLLRRVFVDVSNAKVPRPAERVVIITKSHDDAGHSGIKRTAPLVAAEYWSHGIHAQVRLHVRSCDTGARVNQPASQYYVR